MTAKFHPEDFIRYYGGRDRIRVQGMNLSKAAISREESARIIENLARVLEIPEEIMRNKLERGVFELLKSDSSDLQMFFVAEYNEPFEPFGER